MNYGLRPHKKDKRDYSRHLTFGSVISSIPLEYTIPTIFLNDQQATSFCVGCSTSETAGDELGQQFAFEWQAAKQRQIVNDPVADGVDLRTGMASGTKYGFLPKGLSPFTLETKGEWFCANWNNWPADLDTQAAKFKEDGYYAVDGVGDTFSNIQTAIWQAAQDPNDKERGVVVGSEWFAEWNTTPDGILPMPTRPAITLHSFLIKGWKVINGVQYLVAQLSQGPSFGDNGMLYFSRALVNKYFDNGLYMFRKNPDPNQIRTISAIVSLLSKLVAIFYKMVPPKPKVTPALPPAPTPAPVQEAPHVSRIRDWALGIQQAEGGHPNDPNMRNNNPGNFTISSTTQSFPGYVGKWEGPTGLKFCVFDTYEDGFNALCQWLTWAAQGQLPRYKGTTLSEYTVIYTADPAGSLKHLQYMAVVMAHLKVVDPNIKISELL